MTRNRAVRARIAAIAILFLPSLIHAQSFNAALSGTVTDPSAAVIPGAQVSLTSESSAAVRRTATDGAGFYSFPNLQPGAYQLRVSAPGFRDAVHKGIPAGMNASVRLDLRLELGTAEQAVEVTVSVSPLNFDNAEVKQAIAPNLIQEIPLLVSGTIRNAASFVTLMPGVATGNDNSAPNARINGGLRGGDETVVDGVTMQEGLMSQSGMVAMNDYPISPESVSEVSVLASNYEPQYGSTMSAVITASTRSGTDRFHGGLHWFHRNTVLNARQFGASSRPKDLENDFGLFLGGPVKLPVLSSGSRKTYFFFNYTGFRIIGGLTKPILTVPSEKMRGGDFSEWPYPIYDPATTRPDPARAGSYIRDPFRGCDGSQANVICPGRIANSLALQWLRYVPLPNRPGVQNNYESPSSPINARFKNSNTQVYRFDHQMERDTFSAILRYRRTGPIIQSQLPPEVATDVYRDPDWNVAARVLWDRTFSPTVLNHLALGFSNFRSIYVNITDRYVDKVPSIRGVASPVRQPRIAVAGYSPYGGNTGGAEDHPITVLNNLTTVVRGSHTFKFGGEYRDLRNWKVPQNNESGTFNFSTLNTGLVGVSSGNAMASFLLESVASATVAFRTVHRWEMVSNAIALHFGDTWRAMPRLSINYGVRWDRYPPSAEKDDQLAFFDPAGANPAAGGLPGRLVFAGNRWGDASYGRRYPEEIWNRAFAPRLGIAFTLDSKTVIRAGYGVFFTQAFYPGYNGGAALDGFDSDVTYSSTLAGLQPAFSLRDGFPQNFTPPPFLDAGYRNGQSLTYRPKDANVRPYTQQWNLTIERQFTKDLYISTAYVGNKGTRLPSRMAPLNALDPKLLSMGQTLNRQFGPADTQIEGVRIPYAGWVQQMKGCAPSVAQALLPYPQYCSDLRGLNENIGVSSYHSFQFKAEKRMARGTWFLVSYTVEKLLTTSDSTQGEEGGISPYERKRFRALAADDVPQILSVAVVYDLPAVNRKGVLHAAFGGWKLNSIFRASSGTPLSFRSGLCNVPGQFRTACIPAILPGADPFAQSMGEFDPNKPLFNASAFEPVSAFNYYYGTGSRVSNVRGFAFYNHDLGLTKSTKVGEKVEFRVRADAFNVWNGHTFASRFDTNLNSPTLRQVERHRERAEEYPDRSAVVVLAAREL